MRGRLLGSTLFVATLLVSRRLLSTMTIVKLDNIWDTVIWSLRVLRSKTVLPRTVEEWIQFAENDPTGQSEWGWDGWSFLRPFFASRGYVLYDRGQTSSVMQPRSYPQLSPPSLRPYPYARTIPEHLHPSIENTYAMILKNPMVWGARDMLGRDVAIKLISDKNKPSQEWLILQRLNQEQLRKDPRNHTIHVVEFITFDNLVFAVMPRWDNAFDPPFSTVGEIMEMTKAYLEVLEFLHSHCIAHLDLGIHNTAMNMYGGFAARRAATTLRDPNEVRYVLIDFGYSATYPPGTNVDSVKIEQPLRYFHAPSPRGLYNPFKADVTMMGALLFGTTIHAAKIVPEIEPLLYRMMDLEEDKRPNASTTLAEFMIIYGKLTPGQLQSPVDVQWNKRIQLDLFPK